MFVLDSIYSSYFSISSHKEYDTSKQIAIPKNKKVLNFNKKVADFSDNKPFIKYIKDYA